MPYFSVIMPTKNRAELIKKAVSSILNQTFPDFELLVIDDNGTDNTEKILKDFNDSRIKYHYLDTPHGPGLARDFGIKKTQGKIIVIADSDDINFPDRLELTQEAFKNNSKIDVIYGRAQRLEPDGTTSFRPTCEFDPQLLKFYNFIANPTTAFKKDFYLQTPGYDPKLHTSEDYDLWLSFLEKNAQFQFIDRPLIEQNIHEGSIILKTKIEEKKANLAYVRQKHHLKKPDSLEVQKLVLDQDLLDYISTPGAIDFWFN